MNKVRRPTAAGYFYPSDPGKLKEEINLLLSVSSSDRKIENIFGLIVPHAGYIYSGRTAAYAYNFIRELEFKNVIIISPSHREYFPGISVFEGEGYSTPFGDIPVNNEMAEELVKDSKLIFRSIIGHREEHAIEVQLPFLQTMLKKFSIVPVVMGDQGKIYIDALSSKLSGIMNKDTLIVASSDLSHYHSKQDAFQLDSIVEKDVDEFNFEKLRSDLEKRNCEACGGGPIVAMMKAAALLNKNRSVILHRSDSGDVSGDNNEVVGYLSAAIYGD